MREDVLSLRAMGGDPVSEEYLKAELYHRAEALKDIPDAPLFFGRLDYASRTNPELEPDSRIRTTRIRKFRNWNIRNWTGRGTTASRGTAFTSAAGMCTRRTARPP